MSYGYGGRPNPFDQRDGPSGGGGGGGYGGGYGAPPRGPPAAAFGQGPRPGGGGGGGGAGPRYGNGPSMGRDEYGSGNVEMASLTQNANAFASGDPNAILNECRSIDRGIDSIDQNLNQLRMLQDRSLNEAEQSGSSTSRQLDALSSETMALYRELTERVRQVKSQRDAQQPKNAPQVGRVDRRLKQAIQSFQQVESAFRKKTQDQMARQFRIVRPDASEAEVRAVVEDTSTGGGQVFQQAMMQSDRRGQARAVLSAVQDRHAALQKIEQQMVELAQLFQDMDTLVVQQEAQVVNIEQKGEEVVENLDKGNEEIAVAVTTARKTRKKKWICLGIVVAIIVVVAVVVVVYIMINKQANGGGGKKRSIEARDAIQWGPNGAPVAGVYAQSKIVVPGLEGDLKPLSKFAGQRVQASRQRQRRYVKAGEAFQQDSSAVEKRYVVAGASFAEVSDSDAADKKKRYVVANEGFTPGGDHTDKAKRYVLNTDFTQDGDDVVNKRFVGGRIGVPTFDDTDAGS